MFSSSSFSFEREVEVYVLAVCVRFAAPLGFTHRKFTMKIELAVAVLTLVGVSAFSTNAFTATKGVAFAPLTMLPKSGQTVEKSSFFPFEDSLSALKQGPNNEAEDGSAGVRQLLGVKGASVETDIWKIRLQLTKVGVRAPLSS